jgi:hypothetical protein
MAGQIGSPTDDLASTVDAGEVGDASLWPVIQREERN